MDVEVNEDVDSEVDEGTPAIGLSCTYLCILGLLERVSDSRDVISMNR